MANPGNAARLWSPVDTELMAERREWQKHRCSGVSGQRAGEEWLRSTPVSELDKSLGMIMGMEY